MNQDDFYIFLRHFIKHTRCTPERPVLLLLDNHDSHLSVKGIDFAKASGVKLLSFPPHCSHKLQPLDRSVFGPLKKYVNSACDQWMRNNPGKTMSIYNIPEIVREALPLASTPNNIQSGFLVSGIWPYNRNIFKDDEFLPSAVTDRPDPTAAERNEVAKDAISDDVDGPASQQVDVHDPTSSTDSPISVATESPEAGPSNAVRFTPSDVRPFPKAGPRRACRKGRKRRKAAILTDTPIRNELAADEERIKFKKIEKANKKPPKRCLQFDNVRPTKDKKLMKAKTAVESSSEEEECFCLICGEPFSNSRQGETWIQCNECGGWAHDECTTGGVSFVCINCNSD